MPVFNYPKKELNVKVVYYGPGLSGKTTNLQKIHDGIKPDYRGKLVSLATQTDRTLFFDFMPLELGSLGGYKVRLHLYTVPGQVHYNATRKLVLKGVDGVVLVADSQKAMTDANIESVLNLEKNLQSYGKSLLEIPHVIQANKRDLEEVIPIEEIDSLLNHHGAIVTEAVASEGTGVMETLTEIVRMVMRGMRDQFAAESEEGTEPGKQEPAPDQVEEPESPSAEASNVAQGAMADKSVDRPEPEPEAKLESTSAEAMVEKPEPESSIAEASTVAQGARAEKSADRPELESDPPIKVLLPVDGVGTIELSINVSARMLEEGEIRALEIDVAGVALTGTTPAPEFVPSHAESVIEAAAPEIEPGGLAAEEVPEDPVSMKKDLPPLGNAPDEPLGVPLDGQEGDDLRIPDLPQEEKVLLEEDLGTAPPEPSSPEPTTEYDPTVQPLDFDFPEPEPEEEPKKGLFGRLKKK
jgi:signal recognition particle receptor subunit beta